MATRTTRGVGWRLGARAVPFRTARRITVAHTDAVQCAMLRKFSDENQTRPMISLAFMETYCEFIHCAAEYHLVKGQTLIGLNNFGRNVYETSWLEIAVK